MKKRHSLALFVVVLACGMVQAATVTDDFNRADTVADSDPALSIGPGWVNGGDPTSTGMILSNTVQAVSVGTSGPYILLNAEVQTLNAGAMTEFILSGTVAMNHSAGSGWAGMVYNFQNSKYYYILRYNGLGDVQVLRVNNGNVNVLQSGSFTHEQGRPYEFSIASSEAYVFEISIKDTVTDTVVYSVTDNSDVLVTSEDGYGGFYSGTDGTRFDDFSLSSTERSPTAVYDNFARADTTADNDASVSVGLNWQDGSGDPEAQYFIQRKKVHIAESGTVEGGAWIIVNNELGTLNDGTGTNFTLIATVQLHSTAGTGWTGLVFNYQDPLNYYEFRFNGEGAIQFLRIVGGAGQTFNAPQTFPHMQGRPYEITITSSEPYHFNISIRDTVTDTIVHSSGPHIETNENFKDGLGGFYTLTNLGWFNDFYLDSTGAPAPDSGYTRWADSWGADIGTDQDDPDNDGLLNIYEYGLGGDPTNSADQGTAPTFGIVGMGGTDRFSYIHPQVADPDSGIAYTLDLTENLVLGPWTNAGYTVDGTNDTGLALDFVSNTTTTVESEKFIRLIIKLK